MRNKPSLLEPRCLQARILSLSKSSTETPFEATDSLQHSNQVFALLKGY